MSRRLQLELLFWSIRLVILFVLPLHVSDIGIYMLDLDRFLVRHEWPYRDFPFEYPPLTFGLLLGPGYLMKTLGFAHQGTFRFLLGLFILPFDYALFRAFLRRPPVAGAAFLYVLLTGALSQLLFDRIDLLVGFGIAYPFLAGRGVVNEARAARGWGIAAALKLVPLLLLPFRLVEAGLPRGRALRAALVAAAPLALSAAFVTAISGGLSFLTQHGRRGVQVEALLGNLFLILRERGFAPEATVATLFRSQQVEGVAGLGAAAKFLFWSILVVVYGSLLFAVRRRGFSTLRAAWLFLLTFVTFGYVFSPQFFLWLIPLAPLVAAELGARARRDFLLSFSLLVLMTGVHFAEYWAYAALRPVNLYFLGARNAGLVAFWVMNWIWFRAGEVSSKRDPALR